MYARYQAMNSIMVLIKNIGVLSDLMGQTLCMLSVISKLLRYLFAQV